MIGLFCFPDNQLLFNYHIEKKADLFVEGLGILLLIVDGEPQGLHKIIEIVIAAQIHFLYIVLKDILKMLAHLQAPQ